MDQSKGQIIDEDGKVYNVMFKYVEELKLGTFKCDEKANAFVFKEKVNNLVHIKVGEERK